MASKILDFIKNNPHNWEELLSQRRIRATHKGNRVCLKYEIEADFSDPLVCEARGIIIDVLTQEVVCHPFDKFFNVQEKYASDIDWNTAKVLEKIDGSLVKLYWYDNEWTFATSSTCDARDASVDGFNGISFYDIIVGSDNYSEIPFYSLDKKCTYLFELVSPQAQIVIRYDHNTLYYLGARNNQSGEETDTDIGIKKPGSFPIRTLEDCLRAAMKLNKDRGAVIHDEGFVVVDGNHNRVKIKSPVYIAMHKVISNRVFSPKRIAELYYQGVSFQTLAEQFPNDAHIIKYYDWQIEEMKHDIIQMVGYARALYNEFNCDRSAVASTIKKSSYAWAGFAALDNKSADEIISMLTPLKISKLISEYDQDNTLHRICVRSNPYQLPKA